MSHVLPGLSFLVAVVAGCSLDTFGLADGQGSSDEAGTSANEGSLATSVPTGGSETSTGPGVTTGPAATTGTGAASDASTGATSDASTGEPACMEASCPFGQTCDADGVTCVPGCNEDFDCQVGTVCDVATKTCKDCLGDDDCRPGTLCVGGECVVGCNARQPCPDDWVCCDGGCFDARHDSEHCGGCEACSALDHAEAACMDGVCGLGECADGYSNCDGLSDTGCESVGLCSCRPNEVQPCYGGPPGTLGEGVCVSGEQKCNRSGTGWSACIGEIVPEPMDLCDNGEDDDCNGVTDDNPDADGDGWTVCGGDCCDTFDGCSEPALVNPGALETPGNLLDDDCDGNKDNPLPSCDAGLASNSNTPMDYVKAIDLCQLTIENPPQALRKWGVISASFTRASGSGVPATNAKSIRNNFGTGGVVPVKNTSLLVFSTGNAADQLDTNPPYADFQNGLDNGADSAAPADWLAANGNSFPNAPGCPGPGSTTAFDSILLKIRIRVPTNMRAFRTNWYFLTAEWPEYICSTYNDMFLALLDSTAAKPADKNVAVYTTPQNAKYPVSANLAKVAPDFMRQCKNGTIGCNTVPGNYSGCVGTGELANTGMQVVEGGCGTNNTTGGGTGWRQLAGNVTPGETMEIRFVLWDTGDSTDDSLVLLDGWEWLTEPVTVGVQP